MFVNLSGPQFVYKLLPQINNAYFNFVTQEVVINEPNHVRVVASVLNNKYLECFVLHSIKGGHTGMHKVCKHKITNYSISEPYPHKKEHDWNSYTLDITYEKI